MAIGDALGAPCQGLKPGRLKQAFGSVGGFLDPARAFAIHPGNYRLKGLYSVPTQQSLAVIDSLLTMDRFDREDLKEVLLSLWGEDLSLFRGHDESLRKAVRRLREGEDPRSSGQAHPGISGIPRSLGPALFFKDDEEAMLSSVIETTLLTHNDPRAVCGALAFSLAAHSIAMNPEAILKNPGDFLEELKNRVESGETFLRERYGRYMPPDAPEHAYTVMNNCLDVLAPCLRESNPDLVKRTLLAEANRHDPSFRITVVTQDFAPVAIPWAIYLAISSRSFGQGVLETVNEGKEACVSGALTGALLGLRFGSEGIPGEWIPLLINSRQIALRGEELAGGFPDWSERVDLATLERKWTLKENEEKASRREEYLHEKEKYERKHPRKPKAAELPPQEEAPFSPPPELVFGSDLPDPIKAKKEKAIRGKKRIEWKEHRRKKKKRGSDGSERGHPPFDDENKSGV